MRYFTARCQSGCHGQGGISFGLIQFEYGFDLSKIKVGIQTELNRQAWCLSVVLMFGPFLFAAAVRGKPVEYKKVQ